MRYYAHTADDRPAQPLAEHLENVAKLAANYAASFSSEEWAYIIGQLHDVGKYQNSFQYKLTGKALHVEHSTAGAQVSVQKYGKQGRLLAAAIMGHHGGLPDGGMSVDSEDDSTICGRLKRKFEDYSAWLQELSIQDRLPAFSVRLSSRNEIGFYTYFFVKMLHSCLVDADFIDTEAYFDNQRRVHDQCASIADLNIRAVEFRREFLESKVLSPINKLRTQILDRCIEAASEQPGFFRLTVPTGGGKTISSLSFALEHASRHAVARVIYAIPFTSIIEQNAAQFRKILGENAVLEHHSNFEWDEGEDSETKVQRLASENWDYPLIVTTNVQLFDSIFADRPSRCRKIHNLANSIVVLDEVQAFPDEYLLPALAALEMLVRYFHCTVVLCTATQPSFDDLLPFKTPIKEIVTDIVPLFDALRRVTMRDIGRIDDNSLIARLVENKQVLCVVNTRKHANQLYTLLGDSEEHFHLSALMCPVHRQEVLNEIRDRLYHGLPCRVISTQLIEAGVDIDFPVVYRALAGLDSIAQAAGRCNREGRNRLEDSVVYIFTPRDALPSGWFQKMAAITQMVKDEHPDLLSPAATESFYKNRYFLQGKDSLDKHAILQRIDANKDEWLYPFQSVAMDFHLIDDNSRAIVIPYDNQVKLWIEECTQSSFPGHYLRKFQRYVVSVPIGQFNAYLKSGWLRNISNVIFVLSIERGYDHEKGLISVDNAMENLIIGG